MSSSCVQLCPYTLRSPYAAPLGARGAWPGALGSAPPRDDVMRGGVCALPALPGFPAGDAEPVSGGPAAPGVIGPGRRCGLRGPVGCRGCAVMRAMGCYGMQSDGGLARSAGCWGQPGCGRGGLAAGAERCKRALLPQLPTAGQARIPSQPPGGPQMPPPQPPARPCQALHAALPSQPP